VLDYRQKQKRKTSWGRILAIATKHFAKDGYHGISLERVDELHNAPLETDVTLSETEKQLVESHRMS
jgi:hypothetical protein